MREILFHLDSMDRIENSSSEAEMMQVPPFKSFSYGWLHLSKILIMWNCPCFCLCDVSVCKCLIALSFVCLPSSLLSYRKGCCQKVKWFYIYKAKEPLNDLRGSHALVTAPGWYASLWLTDITWWTGNQFDQMFLWIIVALANCKRLSP